MDTGRGTNSIHGKAGADTIRYDEPGGSLFPADEVDVNLAQHVGTLMKFARNPKVLGSQHLSSASRT